jgi:predicted HTH transcriptional regulator
MSYALMGKTLPNPIHDYQVALLVAKILRAEHQETDAVVKRIARATGANTETVKKWYNAQNTPSAANLMTLMRTYPSLYEAILKLTQVSSLSEGPDRALFLSQKRIEADIYRDKSVTINIHVTATAMGNLNLRQAWFMSELYQGVVVRAADIAGVWSINIRTAKRDVAQLVRFGVIIYQGSKKTGAYMISVISLSN